MVNEIIKLLQTNNISEAKLELIRDIIICEMISSEPKKKKAHKNDDIQFPNWDASFINRLKHLVDVYKTDNNNIFSSKEKKIYIDSIEKILENFG